MARESYRRVLLAGIPVMILVSGYFAFRSQSPSDTGAGSTDERPVVADFDEETLSEDQDDPLGQASRDNQQKTDLQKSTEDSVAARDDLLAIETTTSSVSDGVAGPKTTTRNSSQTDERQSTKPSRSITSSSTSSPESTIKPATDSSTSKPTFGSSSTSQIPSTADRSSTTRRETTTRQRRTTTRLSTTQPATTRRSTTRPTTTRRTTTRRTTTQPVTTRPSTTRPTTTRPPTTRRTTTTQPPPTIRGPQELVNNGFEQFNVSAGENRTVSDLGWWSDTGIMEVWGTGYDEVNAVSGRHLIELNSNGADTIYQRINTDPGATYEWSFYHRGRDGQEAVRVLFDGRTLATRSAGLSWTKHTGEFVIPANQTSIEFGLRSATSGERGNLIDVVELRKIREP